MMDPDTVLEELRQALADRNGEAAMRAADLLDGWLTAGGFPPSAWVRNIPKDTRLWYLPRVG